MKLRTAIFSGLVALLFVTIFVASVFAESLVYYYQGKDGSLVFTKNLAEVPADQREQATKKAVDLERLPPVNVMTSPPTAPPPQRSTSASSQNDTRKTQAYWQERYDTANRDLDQAKFQLQVTQYNIRDNKSLGGPGMQKRMAELSQREEDLKKLVADLEKQVSGGIAEEARQAGAPSEWYRNLQVRK